MARTLQEIQNDYDTTCLKLGEAYYKIKVANKNIGDLEAECAELENKCDVLQNEAIEFAKIEKSKPAEIKDVQPQ